MNKRDAVQMHEAKCRNGNVRSMHGHIISKGYDIYRTEQRGRSVWMYAKERCSGNVGWFFSH